MTAAIVTKESLKKMLSNPDMTYIQTVLGRGLMVLYRNQTDDERIQDNTLVNNGVGFNSSDAKSGTLTAKFYKRHHRLEDWMSAKWLKLDKNGYPRLCKYHKQLNIAAELRTK